MLDVGSEGVITEHGMGEDAESETVVDGPSKHPPRRVPAHP